MILFLLYKCNWFFCLFAKLIKPSCLAESVDDGNKLNNTYIKTEEREKEKPLIHCLVTYGAVVHELLQPDVGKVDQHSDETGHNHHVNCPAQSSRLYSLSHPQAIPLPLQPQFLRQSTPIIGYTSRRRIFV